MLSIQARFVGPETVEVFKGRMIKKAVKVGIELDYRTRSSVHFFLRIHASESHFCLDSYDV